MSQREVAKRTFAALTCRRVGACECHVRVLDEIAAQDGTSEKVMRLLEVSDPRWQHTRLTSQAG